MQISQEETGLLTARIKVVIEEADYAGDVEEQLRELRRKSSIPGFRPGKVPAGMIKRMYGKSVLLEKVNKLLSDGITGYIQENKLDILGSPLGVDEGSPRIDWDLQKDFEFWFDIGLTPEAEPDLGSIEGMKLYRIVPTEDELNSYIADLQRRMGSHIHPEESMEGDILKGLFTELGEDGEALEEGIQHESSLFTDYIKNEEARKRFIGMKAGESLVFNPMQDIAHTGEIASLLGIPKEKAEDIRHDFRFTLTEITRLEPAETGEEFFNKVFPEADIDSEEVFRARVREDLEGSYQGDARNHFFNDALKALIERKDFEIPEDFLKRWLQDNSKTELTEEALENQLPAFLRSMRWQIIQEKLMNRHGLNVTEMDIRLHIQDFFQRQYGLPVEGSQDLDPRLAPIIDRVMENEQEVRKISEQISDERLADLFMREVPHETENITYADFVKMVKESREKEENEQ